MSWRRAIAESLDRSPLRSLLSLAATIWAIAETKAAVRVGYDDVWGVSVSGLYLPVSIKFEFSRGSFGPVVSRLRSANGEARQLWFPYGMPPVGGTVVDVGAGIGVDELLFSSAVGAEGRVLAIEAHPATFLLLKKLCERNGLRNTAVRQFAILDAPGWIELQDDPEHESNSILDTQRGDRVLAVPGTTLDALLEEERIDRVDFLKMNIEGAELAALDGMRRTLERTEQVCIACHDFRCDRGESGSFRTRDSVQDRLVRSGFHLLPRPKDSRPWVRDHVHARRHP